MNKSDILARFRINIAWSDEDAAFVATVPAMSGCAADGATPAEAIRELEIALDGHLAARAAHGLPPPSDPLIERVRRLAPMLNLSEVARASGLKTSTLRSKLERGTAFSPDESRKVHDALAAYGISCP